ncbi:MAG: twin-arginine translocase subunit TatC [Ignavibacteriales bacterium]|nr:twin-arginine translocase subunit TatC [Ignavibacteriales bacterium]
MSFLEHLEELRWRILYIIIGLIIGTIAAWIFIDFFVEKILLLPANKANLKLQNLKPFGQLFLYLEVAMIIGFIISVPNFFYQVWKFVAPALKKNEKKYVFSIVTFTTICFIAGIVFAYFVMLPLTLQFASQFGTERIENNFAVNEYFSIILSVMIGAGVVFELPMLSFFLSKIGILTPKIMRKFWRHSILTIFVMSAVLTPGGDPISQILLAVPLILLYEISILISRIFSKKKEEFE